ncbi:MAG: hypothetical protein M0Z54_11710 [Thermaerobacter sp.]|nr:hypothetical protein [Thermaerobacter sp.]
MSNETSPPEPASPTDEQKVADAFFAWAPAELMRRRQASQEALARARVGRDEVRWRVAERAEARRQQLSEMMTTHAP